MTLGYVNNSNTDHFGLQQNLDKLLPWSIDSDLLFSVCIYIFNKSFHLSFKTPTSYLTDRNLGIQISDNLS